MASSSQIHAAFSEDMMSFIFIAFIIRVLFPLFTASMEGLHVYL